MDSINEGWEVVRENPLKIRHSDGSFATGQAAKFILETLRNREGFQEQYTKEHFIDIVEALHLDQTGLAETLSALRKVASGWSWAIEGRGAYAWDDDEYRKEFGYCLAEIDRVITDGLTRTRLAHAICCGQYGHLHRFRPEPHQLRIEFDKSYASLLCRILKKATVEGRI